MEDRNKNLMCWLFTWKIHFDTIFVIRFQKQLLLLAGAQVQVLNEGALSISTYRFALDFRYFYAGDQNSTSNVKWVMVRKHCWCSTQKRRIWLMITLHSCSGVEWWIPSKEDRHLSNDEAVAKPIRTRFNILHTLFCDRRIYLLI